MTISSFPEACAYLDRLQMHKIKLGLEAVGEVLASLGSPQLRCPAVHVAGTNGKGSVCAMLQEMAVRAGYRTGLYTSPHLSSIRERFRINGRFISEAEFTEQIDRIARVLDGSSITYFECTTALAFSWFAAQQCELVLIETGMGGRLDATNVITPLLSVITTVSLDHEQYLGASLEAVAAEKAGIIKPGVPVISGVCEPPADTVIEATCARLQAPLQTREVDFSMQPETTGSWSWYSAAGSRRLSGLRFTDASGWQVENGSCAVAAAVLLRQRGYNLEDSAIRDGLAGYRWPGRLEWIEAAAPTETGRATRLRFLLDGAHNPAGVERLLEVLRDGVRYDRLILVWGSMADKHYQPMLAAVAGIADQVLLTRAESERSASPRELERVLASQLPEKSRQCCLDVRDAYVAAGRIAQPEDLVVVAGSLYLIGEFRRLLVGEVVR